ncbi:hypothetical protein CAEBREN_19143 [Caenorhabditis brenneri]|uniref:Uncharacterized protein n=1 Tax=Caenorhabditis brenneri TaxID=135651 RepID=G0NJA2_CAEBE|nr:hypothetical protein CAEBREN_19143 [Caenorhabditis brenneri]
MKLLKPLQDLADKCKVCWKHVAECDLDNPCGCLVAADDIVITRQHLITLTPEEAAKFRPVPLSFVETMLGESPMKMGDVEPEYYLSEALFTLFGGKDVVYEQNKFERKMLQLRFKRTFCSLVVMHICKAIRVLLRRKAPPPVQTRREEFNLLIHSVPRGYYHRR